MLSRSELKTCTCIVGTTDAQGTMARQCCGKNLILHPSADSSSHVRDILAGTIQTARLRCEVFMKLEVLEIVRPDSGDAVSSISQAHITLELRPSNSRQGSVT